MNHPIRLFLTASALLAGSLHAHNGAFVTAEPIDGITIDGDLSDWPDTLIEYSTSHADCGDEPLSGRDLSARFRVGCNLEERTLLVAVEVTDDSVVYDADPGCKWNTQDGCTVYVDRTNSGTEPTVAQYFLCGKELRAYGTANAEDATVKFTRDGNLWRYEWAIQLGDAFVSDRPIGFDLDVTDKDADGSFTWQAWSPGKSKIYYPANNGDLFLRLPQEPMGRVTGVVDLPSGLEGVIPNIVFTSNSESPRRIQVTCDPTGEYDVCLPVGSYSLELVLPPTTSPVETLPEPVNVEVAPHTAVVADPLAFDREETPQEEQAVEEEVAAIEEAEVQDEVAIAEEE